MLFVWEELLSAFGVLSVGEELPSAWGVLFAWGVPLAWEEPLSAWGVLVFVWEELPVSGCGVSALGGI